MSLPRLAWTALGMIWIGGVVVGLACVARYDNAPGVPAAAPARWPADSRLVPDRHGPTVVMLAHPRCDCTAASITELAEIMARARVAPKTYVVFIKPGTVAGGWENTELWHAAAAIPGVTVVRDDDGVEAGRFGAETSGQLFLYTAAGALSFSGGITGARAHAGDNAGRASIVALLNHEDPPRTTTAVFGCPLFASADVRPSAPSTESSRHVEQSR